MFPECTDRTRPGLQQESFPGKLSPGIAAPGQGRARSTSFFQPPAFPCMPPTWPRGRLVWKKGWERSKGANVPPTFLLQGLNTRPRAGNIPVLPRLIPQGPNKKDLYESNKNAVNMQASNRVARRWGGGRIPSRRWLSAMQHDKKGAIATPGLGWIHVQSGLTG